MRSTDVKTATWRESTHSEPNGAECHEVAGTIPDVVPAWDSEIPEELLPMFGTAAWSGFVPAYRTSRADAEE